MMNGFCYTATISLNNTGVSLIQRGYVAEALETLTDAVTIVLALLQHQQGDHHQVKIPTYAQISSSLHTANQRAAILPPLKTGSVRVVSHNQADYVSIQPSRALALIRIEEDTEELELDLVYAIMLANLSLLIMGRGTEEAEYAVGCLQLSHSLLNDLVHRYHGLGDPFMLKRVAHLSTVCLLSLASALASIGQQTEADTTSRELYYLYRLAGSLDETGLFSNWGILPASAA
jgi:hypothetical protein